MATSNTTPKTVVLTARGLEPDTRFHVLDHTIFHVHSVFLKANSAFFFKFLDSATNITSQAVAAPASGRRFKYDWVTKVDDDGTWSLIAATDGKLGSQNITKFGGNLETHVQTFWEFLDALHAKPWDIPDIASLKLLTEFADYYCALPVVSRSLSDVLLHGAIRWDIKFGMRSQLPTLLEISYKLRHRVLFGDSVVAMAGMREGFYHNWQILHNWDVRDEILRCISKVSNEIDVIVSCAHQRMMERFRYDAFRNAIVKVTEYYSLPHYYRILLEQILDEVGDSELGEAAAAAQEITKPVLSKKLVLDPCADLPGQDGQYRDSFLCYELEEADFPWDLTQEDW